MGALLLGDPAAHVFVAVLDAAVAGEGFAIEAGAEACEGDRDFVGRARRIGADGAVDERVGGILVDRVPIGRGDRGDENIGIVGGDGGHGEDVAVAGIEDHSGSATYDAQGLLGEVLDFRIDGEIDIATLDWLAAADFAFDDALGVAAHDAGAGLALEVLVQIQLELGFAFDIGLVEIEFPEVGEFVEVARGAHIAEEVRGHGAVNIPAHGFDADIDACEAEIFFREEGHLVEAEILAVVVGHFAVRAVVDLKGVCVVILGDAEFLHARDDGLGDDLHDIGLLEVARHVVHAAAIGGHGHGAFGFAVGADHIGEVEIDFEAGAIFDELDAVAVEDLAAHGGEAHGDLRAGIDAGGVFLALEDLDIPEPPGDGRHGENHQRAEEKNA